MCQAHDECTKLVSFPSYLLVHVDDLRKFLLICYSSLLFRGKDSQTQNSSNDEKNEGFLKRAFHKFTHPLEGHSASNDGSTNQTSQSSDVEEEKKKASGSG